MKQLIDDITTKLLRCYPEDEARSLAWWIMEELTGLSRSDLQFGCKDTAFSPIMQEQAQKIIARLLHFEPIQYIFGHTLWNGLDLKLTPATLIPRPETAELIDRINDQMVNDQMVNDLMVNDQMVNVLDIGTGSGCIAIALKKAHPEWQVTGIDISPEAIAIARENALRNNVDVRFLVADILSPETAELIDHINDQMVNDQMVNDLMVNDQMVNIFVSNPPYICESERAAMRPNVLDFEPASALFVPDDDPLIFYRRIATLFSSPLMGKGGKRGLFFEINESYGSQLSAMLGGLGYSDIRVTKDIYGKDRIVEASLF